MRGYRLLLGDQPASGGVHRPRRRDLAARASLAAGAYLGGVYWGLGHPFIFAREAFGELRGLHGDKAVWKLIEAYPERVSRVEIEAALPPDVDTPEDYGLALAHWRSSA